MHLGPFRARDSSEYWNQARRSNIIGLAHEENVPKKWDSLSDSEKKRLFEQNPRIAAQFRMFCNEMMKGDIVLILGGRHWLRGVAQITKDNYRFEANPQRINPLNQRIEESLFGHIRDVRWLKGYGTYNPLALGDKILGLENILTRVPRSSKLWGILTDLDSLSLEQLSQYMF
jgi:hypothetical protein